MSFAPVTFFSISRRSITTQTEVTAEDIEEQMNHLTRRPVFTNTSSQTANNEDQCTLDIGTQTENIETHYQEHARREPEPEESMDTNETEPDHQLLRIIDLVANSSTPPLVESPPLHPNQQEREIEVLHALCKSLQTELKDVEADYRDLGHNYDELIQRCIQSERELHYLQRQNQDQETHGQLGNSAEPHQQQKQEHAMEGNDEILRLITFGTDRPAAMPILHLRSRPVNEQPKPLQQQDQTTDSQLEIPAELRKQRERLLAEAHQMIFAPNFIQDMQKGIDDLQQQARTDNTLTTHKTAVRVHATRAFRRHRSVITIRPNRRRIMATFQEARSRSRSPHNQPQTDNNPPQTTTDHPPPPTTSQIEPTMRDQLPSDYPNEILNEIFQQIREDPLFDNRIPYPVYNRAYTAEDQRNFAIAQRNWALTHLNEALKSRERRAIRLDLLDDIIDNLQQPEPEN
jgi:hypothetical protein